jgi:CMP-N-acetylneuraminic acid synthetase
MKIVGVIPARAGSKGIPGKNIQIIGGLPLIAWSINALNESKYIEHTYVSSDSENILNIASTYGASLIKRPEEFSQDQSSTEDFLNHFILYLESKQIYTDIIV